MVSFVQLVKETPENCTLRSPAIFIDVYALLKYLLYMIKTTKKKKICVLNLSCNKKKKKGLPVESIVHYITFDSFKHIDTKRNNVRILVCYSSNCKVIFILLRRLYDNK